MLPRYQVSKPRAASNTTVVAKLPPKTCRQGTWVWGTNRYKQVIPVHNKTNSNTSKAVFIPGPWLRSEPPDQLMTEAMVTRPAVSSKGPRVKTAQYNKTRWPMGLGFRTRQIVFRLRSMVKISTSAENNKAAKLTEPKRLALVVNCVM